VKRRHRKDDNEPEIVKALKKVGCKVCKIGRPVDLLVGFRSHNFLLEVKNPKGRNTLEDSQKEFIATWPGQVRVVRSPDEAVRVVTESYKWA